MTRPNALGLSLSFFPINNLITKCHIFLTLAKKFCWDKFSGLYYTHIIIRGGLINIIHRKYTNLFYFSLLFVCGKKMNEKCPIGSEPPWNWIPLWKTSLLIACPDLIMHCYQLYKPCIVSYIMTFKFQKELYWLFLLFCLQFVIMGNFPVMRAEVRCGWLLFNLIDN